MSELKSFANKDLVVGHDGTEFEDKKAELVDDLDAGLQAWCCPKGKESEMRAVSERFVENELRLHSMSARGEFGNDPASRRAYNKLVNDMADDVLRVRQMSEQHLDESYQDFFGDLDEEERNTMAAHEEFGALKDTAISKVFDLSPRLFDAATACPGLLDKRTEDRLQNDIRDDRGSGIKQYLRRKANVDKLAEMSAVRSRNKRLGAGLESRAASIEAEFGHDGSGMDYVD